jgi:methyl-accepting chemotaxis protein
VQKSAARRRFRIIDSPFQYRMIAIWLTVVLAGFVAFSAGLTLYYWLSSTRGDNLLRESITLHKQVTEIKVVVRDGVETPVKSVTTRDVPGLTRLELILPPLLINNLVIMVFVIGVGIVTSLSIAGPVLRMQRDMERALSGEDGVRVRVRRSDSFPELAQKINQLLERLDAGHDGRG